MPLTLTPTRSITLEESDSLVNMTPRVSITPDGRILVVDPSFIPEEVHEPMEFSFPNPGQGT